METEKKRRPGQIHEESGMWLVLHESTGKEPGPYIHSCGTKIQGARVAHPIWDGPFPCSGGGQCRYETVPFCPNCEEEPNFNGAPVKE